MGGHPQIVAGIWCDEQRVDEPGVLPHGRLLTKSGAWRISSFVVDLRRATAYEPRGDGQATQHSRKRGGNCQGNRASHLADVSCCMFEGLSSATDVGREIAEHAHHGGNHHTLDRRDRVLTIVEAVHLSLATLAAAWSGFAAAKWNGESAVSVALASDTRTDASRANLDAREDRSFDLSTFEAWFGAYVADNQEAMALAEHRFRPEFAVVFDAWRATNPETNPDAPRGATVLLANVRFLVGISATSRAGVRAMGSSRSVPHCLLSPWCSSSCCLHRRRDRASSPDQRSHQRVG